MRLRKLVLDNTSIDHDMLNSISESSKSEILVKLRTLSLRNCRYFTGFGFVALHKMRILSSLKQILYDGNKIEFFFQTYRQLRMMKTLNYFSKISFCESRLFDPDQLNKYLTSHSIVHNLSQLKIDFHSLNAKVLTTLQTSKSFKCLTILLINSSQVAELLRLLNRLDLNFNINLISKLVPEL
jgi:hypothetical protein